MIEKHSELKRPVAGDDARNNRTGSIEKGEKALAWSLWITSAGALLVLFGLLTAYYFYPPDVVHNAIESAKGYLAIWRIVIFLTIIGGWRRWTLLYAAWTGMNDAQIQRMLGYRWRMALWLLIMEAVFSQGVLADFVNNLLVL